MKIFFKGSEGNSSLAGGQTIQYPEMPTASTDLAGKIVQYVGTTNTNYTNGYFYKCVLQAGAYKWEPKTVQTGGGGGGGDVPIATTETPGIVKPDGTTITVDNDGTMHSIGGGSADFPAGGTTGQALIKASDADNDVEWGNMPTVPIEKITVNGTEQPITNKTVAITVITETVNNLVNYYTKTETYTREQVHQIISTASFGGFEVVATLPTTDISTKTIYLVPKSPPETGNVYDEFIYVNNSWENIGDTEIDLTVYQTKNLSSPITVGGTSQTTVEDALSAINGLFASYLTTSAFNTTIVDYYTKTQVDTTTGDLANLATTNKTNLVGAINELNAAGRPRTEVVISAASNFRSAGQGSYSFKTSTAVTITLADANTITIPANIQGIFDVGETDATLNDYIGLIQYTNNGYEKKIYFTSSVFYVPSTDSVQIDDNNVSSATTYSSAKIETAIGGSKASQMTGATAYQDGKAGLATKPVAGDNQKALFGDGKYHNIYAANTGSVVVAVTDEPDLYGQPVTLTAGSTTLNGTFSSMGECTFNNLALYGAVQIASEDINGNPARGSTNITYFGTYVVGIGFNFATIKFTSTDISLVGESVAIYLGNNLVAETSLSLINGHLEAICYVEQLGTYRAIAKTTEGTARASVTVTSLKQTFTSELIIADIYGFIIDQNDSNPATCVKPYDLNDYDVINRNYTPAHMDFTNDSFDYGSWSALATCDRDSVFFAPKPCMLNYDGTVAYYLDPNDYTMKIDGTASDVADMTYGGNVMVEFPTIWFKRWTNNKKIYCLISNKQLDSDFHAWAHHDISGNVLDYIYISAFFGSVDNSKMRSIAGVQPSSALTRNYEVSYAINNNVAGNQAEGWYILHKSEYTMIIDLLILIGMNTNSQAVYGDGSQTVQLNGSLNNSGIFYGDNQGNCATKVFGIEGLWGCLGMSVSGWISGVPQKAKMTYGQEDNTTNTGFNFDGTGYKEISNASMANGDSQFIKEMEYNEYGYFPILGGGSSSTYYCDAISYSSGGAYPIVGWGGNIGLFAGYFKESSSVSYGMFATRLTYKSIASP